MLLFFYRIMSYFRSETGDLYLPRLVLIWPHKDQGVVAWDQVQHLLELLSTVWNLECMASIPPKKKK